ncbi:hypothetical protein PC129_g12391 [Phytophthora cactorum]|uniref:Uncharacterized protein n=1 Tax=Phytophthora cactorum TaxID=29920 RepID=A0A329S939_9STRA|nr:hypothetical protein Pcac1_g5066 [Phytophthora cactorum]KAG2816582.1 hypothetical protein PC111_g13082 [Phytophthora cactorum]KAG2816679.1 hypothetical protein PC112_g13352 [Phytophthora cactorum]KAG2853148.1 hypothetical protein PC113_g14423 [Phytophthora cactorum]KAG2895621.1 hypothetical protein PC114_g15411 [Phytophthora cactorum]
MQTPRGAVIDRPTAAAAVLGSAATEMATLGEELTALAV